MVVSAEKPSCQITVDAVVKVAIFHNPSTIDCFVLNSPPALQPFFTFVFFNGNNVKCISHPHSVCFIIDVLLISVSTVSNAPNGSSTEMQKAVVN